MDVLAVSRLSSPFAGDALYLDGDLDLYQRGPLEITDRCVDVRVHLLSTVAEDFVNLSIVNAACSIHISIHLS